MTRTLVTEMKKNLLRKSSAARGQKIWIFVFGFVAILTIFPELRAQSVTTIREQNPSALQQSSATAIGLARAAQQLPDADRLRTIQAALSIVLLTKFDRLLPSLPPASLDLLAQVFLCENPDLTEQESTAAKLPPADILVFDGSKLTGGNFRNIDALIGAGGRPIALDRDLPSWIVPLEAARAQALESQRGIGMTGQKFEELQSLFNRIHVAEVGQHLVSDGIFLRPYAGRMDDLYHNLVQKGGRNGQLDYFALLDSLPPRQYSPIAGTAARKFVPPLRLNLSNVLSGGSLQAIQDFKADHPSANVLNPFKGFAVRALPYLPELLRKTSPGSELRISGDVMRRAISDPRRYSPDQAPPLFLDPSRFLGQWDDPRFIRVSKNKKNANAALLAEIQKVDFETPLPEMFFDPPGNELLAKPPTRSSQPETNELLQDLGLPLEADTSSTYEPADAPEPVLPPTRAQESEVAPSSVPLLTKPAPPILDLEPLETPPSFDFVQAQTPEPPAKEISAVPEPTAIPSPMASLERPEPAPTATPAPQPIKPSAIALIPLPEAPKPSQTPIPEPEKTIEKEPQVAKAIPVNTPIDSIEQVPDTSTSPYQVAVLTPTANESIQYLKKIAASDIALSDNIATARRADCVIRWLGDAVKPFETVLLQTPDSAEAKAIEPLITQARDEVVALLSQRDTLQSARLQELASRQAARDGLEKETQTTRRTELKRRTGTGA
jgi:hypothetical protein